MAADTSDTSEFKIIVIPADEDGCRFYLEQCKPFRLASLRQDPDAFGSTYAREIEFDDEAWLGRIKNPSVTTFVAVHSHDDRVVASTSLIGPLPNANPVSNPYQVLSESERMPQSDGDVTNENNDTRGEPLCFQMAAVYTSPEARGRGLAKSLIKSATEEARKKARGQGRPLVLSVVVYATNTAAISVYERCGFVRDPEGPKLVFNAFKNSSFQELEMFLSGAS
ncbi:hypothetical protein HD806DRAFT_169716 [Xylariaceae sp. AK1471]|nr:hypothetical protein HD806DRAFT_169716 [Xylariaceae sp. AK1471]